MVITQVSPQMLRAYADLKEGPLVRLRHAFVGKSGQRHHTQVIEALVLRALARTHSPRPKTTVAELTPLGSALRPEER